MTIDVLLEPNSVTLLADGASGAGAERVIAQTADLEVNLPSRRAPNAPTTMRRAVVHDWGDRLTLNWGGDYPGGVRIEGSKTEVTGKLVVELSAPVTVANLESTAGNSFSASQQSFDVVDEIVALRKEAVWLRAQILLLKAQVGAKP
jgi:hypothetical protein